MDFVNICRKALYFRGSLSICPAYAGVILQSQITRRFKDYLSRVCGGDPNAGLGGNNTPSICPAYAGVIPIYCILRINM